MQTNRTFSNINQCTYQFSQTLSSDAIYTNYNCA